jgi:hypothetical protein
MWPREMVALVVGLQHPLAAGAHRAQTRLVGHLVSEEGI